jgi:hypothetical protein
MAPDEYGNWALVRYECKKREKIRVFLDSILAEERRVVIQIDTDRAAEYGVEKPTKVSGQIDEYVDELFRRVVAAITAWLEGEFLDRIFFAVPIEETEAWLLAHWEPDVEETAVHHDPKRRLHNHLNSDKSGMSASERRQVLRLGERDKAQLLSVPLKKAKALAEAAGRSRSLRLFIEQLPRAKE